ncbi:C4-type zinc ribbon domain-containing protein [Brevibacillus daliensis]|uniref:C4-type zinc ribbon domain-containing protein n=1 Tax=Brevibacillus daliensis TaxID=2892995 RepID=UPI001E39DD44|nr:C4-type zinc ribbon domain-containing protein [Brevibacillus daliensis]
MSSTREVYKWHQLQVSVEKEEAELLAVLEQEQSKQQQIVQLKQKIAAMPISTEEEQISKLLAEQELWMANKEFERIQHELLERKFSLEQSITYKKLDIEAGKINLDKDVLTAYEKVAETKKNPIVEVKNKSCMGCFMPLSLSNYERWRRGKGLVYCDECERILV